MLRKLDLQKSTKLQEPEFANYIKFSDCYLNVLTPLEPKPESAI